MQARHAQRKPTRETHIYRDVPFVEPTCEIVVHVLIDEVGGGKLVRLDRHRAVTPKNGYTQHSRVNAVNQAVDTPIELTPEFLQVDLARLLQHDEVEATFADRSSLQSTLTVGQLPAEIQRCNPNSIDRLGIARAAHAPQ
jgi:hypothetical protein